MNRSLLLENFNTIPKCIVFLRQVGVLKNFWFCDICGSLMQEVKFKNIDKIIWSCQKRIEGTRHNKKKSIRSGSILFNSKLDLIIFIKIVYEWSQKNSINKTAMELNINKNTICRLFFLFQNIVCNIVGSWRTLKIGESNQIVEINECQIRQRKYLEEGQETKFGLLVE